MKNWIFTTKNGINIIGTIIKEDEKEYVIYEKSTQLYVVIPVKIIESIARCRKTRS